MDRLKKHNKIVYVLAGLLAGAGCIIMMMFPAMALHSAQKGVYLWASSVLPALLPFFICANFMIALGLPAVFGRFFESSFRKIFGAPGVSAFIFSISITSGYPMGAKLIGDLGRRKEITTDDAKRILTFCSTSGPLFMLGAVGAGMLGSTAAGVVIAVSHYLGALLNGLFYRLFYALQIPSPKSCVKYNKIHTRMHLPKENLLDIFTESILSSFKALGVICGYIVLFTLATDFMQFTGVLNYLDTSYGKSLAKGFLEMTVGCNSVALAEDIDLTIKCVVCSILISWGGVSILAQSMSMLNGLNISVWYYAYIKLTHALISGYVAWVIAPFILNLEAINTGAFGQQDLVNHLGFIYSLLFSTKMVIIIVIIFILTIMANNLIRRIHERFRDHSGV